MLLCCSGCQHLTKACVRSDEQISHACVSSAQPHSSCQNRDNSTERMSCAHCQSRCCSFCGMSGHCLGEDKVFLRVDTTDKTQSWTRFEPGEDRYQSLPCPGTFAGLDLLLRIALPFTLRAEFVTEDKVGTQMRKQQRGRSCSKTTKRKHIQRKI